MTNTISKEKQLPTYTWEAILQLLKEGQENGQSLEAIVFRIARLAYTAGLDTGLHTALSLCEETAHKIHTISN